MIIEITDNSQKFIEELNRKGIIALEKCGLVAEGHAKKLCPVDTGNLRNSITHNVEQSELTAYIGSAVDYSVYVCLGTGKYYPGGRDTPWAYQDSKGNWHRTSGQKAQPFLKPAIADNIQQYEGIIEGELKE